MTLRPCPLRPARAPVLLPGSGGPDGIRPLPDAVTSRPHALPPRPRFRLDRPRRSALKPGRHRDDDGGGCGVLRVTGPKLGRIAAMVAAGLLAGCQVGPAFRSPTLAVPPRFAAASPANAPPAWPKPGWWRAFGSPELSSLVEAARQHNFSVREAIAQL